MDDLDGQDTKLLNVETVGDIEGKEEEKKLIE